MLSKMKIIKRTTQILFFIFHCWFSNSGSRVLTIEDAIKIALENNYDIKLPKKPRVDETNVSSGNAGMLPRATAPVTDNNSVQNLNQTRIDGTEA
jgi:hypothetical protein